MEKEEVAEAIIVVGPYLWKCVNCNILMSRQHSIDYHLHCSHYSDLHPRNGLEVEATDGVTDCQIPLCHCHKFIKKTQIQKQKRKLQISHQNRPSPTKKKRTDQEGGDFSEANKITDEEVDISNEVLEGKGGEADKVPHSCVESVTTVNDNDAMEPFSVKISEKTLTGSTMHEECSGNHHRDLTSNSEDRSNSGMIEGNSLPETFSCLEDDFPAILTDVKDKPFSFLGNDRETVESGVSVRKSRRSNKGRNSLYTQYEMKHS